MRLMRCPECQNFLSWSFMDEQSREAVYQCSTRGVPIFYAERVVNQTLDHSDYFYVNRGRELVRVEPLNLGKTSAPFWSTRRWMPKGTEEGNI